MFFWHIIEWKYLKLCHASRSTPDNDNEDFSKNSHEENSRKVFSCLIKTSIGCFKARNYLLIASVYVFDRN